MSLTLILTVAGAAAVATPAEPEVVDEEIVEDDTSEKALLRKKGIPSPPTQDRKGYLAWKKKLPKQTQKKIDRFCRNDGAGTYYEVCNGIGPYAIPKPPSRVAPPRRGPNREVIGLTVEGWEASLSPIQRRYYEDYCAPTEGDDEGNGYSELCGGTPIVLAFDNERVAYSATDATTTDWPTATTPWLARDLDGDGAITPGPELFGSDTALPDGSLARHGFAALAALDDNRDGVLDARDAAFATLLVWADHDGNRVSSRDELTRLADRVVSISLDHTKQTHCDARGNCEGERSTITWRDATGALRTGSAIDVYLRAR